ncbi:hypothetical protein XPA_010223 [Xanthoria parietina]
METEKVKKIKKVMKIKKRLTRARSPFLDLMILGLVMPSSDESLLASPASSSDKNPVAPAVAAKVSTNLETKTTASGAVN